MRPGQPEQDGFGRRHLPLAQERPPGPVECGRTELVLHLRPRERRECRHRVPVAAEPEESLPQRCEQFVAVRGRGRRAVEDVGCEPAVGRLPCARREERPSEAELVRRVERPSLAVDEDGRIPRSPVARPVVERAAEIRLRLPGGTCFESEPACPEPRSGRPRGIPLSARVFAGNAARAGGVSRPLVCVGERSPPPAREVGVRPVHPGQGRAHPRRVPGGGKQFGEDEGTPVGECRDGRKRRVGAVRGRGGGSPVPRLDRPPQLFERLGLHCGARHGFGEERCQPLGPLCGPGCGLASQRPPDKQCGRHGQRGEEEGAEAPPPREKEPGSDGRVAAAFPCLAPILHSTHPVPPHPPLRVRVTGCRRRVHLPRGACLESTGMDNIVFFRPCTQSHPRRMPPDRPGVVAAPWRMRIPPPAEPAAAGLA